MAFIARNLRWLAAGFLLTFASSAGQTYFIALFATDLRTEFGLSHGGFGTVYLVATLASALATVWIGRTADAVRAAPLAAAVMLILAATAFAMSQVSGIVGLVVVIFLLRLFGQGMPHHVALTALARWYARKRGRAIGIAALGLPASEAVLPLLAVLLIAGLGWRETWMVIAAGLALIFAPATYWLLRREPAGPAAETTGLDETAVTADDDAVDTADDRHHWTQREVIRDPLFYVLLMGMLVPAFILTGVFFHQAHIVEVKGWSLTLWAAAFPAYSAASIVVSLLTGLAVDRWSAGHLLPLYLLPLCAGLTLLALAQSPLAAPMFMALAGATSGASLSLLGALWAELYGTQYLGGVRAIIMAAFVAASALSPGVMGWLIDFGVPIERQIGVAAAYGIVAMGLFFILVWRVPRLTAA